MLTTPCSRLAAFCAGVIEAGWLGALVITVMFFNHLSFRSFEPDKAAMLRVLALLILLAWVVWIVEAVFGREGFGAARNRLRPGNIVAYGWWRGAPMLMPVLALGISTLLSTVFSVDWEISLRGSYERGQGLYTFSAYLVLFLSVALLLRTREQFERLVTTLILTAIPVSLLGLMQHQGIDPIPYDAPARTPVVSTMGNTIFVAAWLVMIVPLVLHRLLGSLISGGRDLPGQTSLFMVGLTVVLFGMLLVGWPRALPSAVLTAATGAVLLLISTWVFRAGRRPWSAVWIYTVILAAIVACALFTERRGPFLGMLTGIFLFALLQLAAHGRWRALLRFVGVGVLGGLMLTAAPVLVPSLLEGTPLARLTQVLETGGSAAVRLHIWDSVLGLSSADPIRLLVGYGPDTLQFVALPYADPQIAGGQSGLPDRAHNMTMELLAGSGLLGMGAYVLLITCLFISGLRWTGLIRGRPGRRLFLIAGVLGAALPVLAVRVFDGSWRGIVVALPAAVLLATLAVAIAAAVRALRQPGQATPGREPSSRQTWSATLLSALAAHLVEAHVGIGIVATQTTFWLLVAASVVVGHRRALLPGQRVRNGVAPSSMSHGREAAPAAADRTGLPLINNSLLVSLVILTLAFNYPLRHFASAHSASILWLFGLTGVLAGLIVASPVGANDSPPRRLGRFVDVGIYTSIFLLTASVAGFVYSLSGHAGGSPTMPLTAYLVMALLTLVVLAVSLMHPVSGEASSHLPRVGMLFYAVLIPFAVAAIVVLNLRSVQADMLFKRGLMGAHRTGHYQEAAHWYRRALQLVPSQDHYHLYLGLALAEQALQQTGQGSRDQTMGQAAEALTAAQARRPLHPVYPESLGRLYLQWGKVTDEPYLSSMRLRQAVGHLDQARDRNPNRPEIWVSAGDAYKLLNEPDAAMRNYRQAVALRPESKAAQRGLAEVLRAQGDYRAALAQLEALIKLVPDDAAAHAERVRLLLSTDGCPSAQRALGKARETVRDDAAMVAVERELVESCSVRE